MAPCRCVAGFWLALLIGIVASSCDSYSKEQEQEMKRIRDSVSADPGTINSREKQGNTPLHLAVLNKYLPLLDWLKDHGADPNSKGLYGDTPLHLAIISDPTSDGRVIRRLLLMGADVNSRTIDGYTPLHIAAISGKAGFVQFLLDKRANRDLRDKRNLTPAEEAIQFPAMTYSKEGRRAVDTSAAVNVLRTYSPK